MFFGVLTGVLWCTYWCSLVYLLVFFGVLTGVLWCTYWCTLVYLLVFFGVLTGVLWCTYWCSMVYLLVFFGVLTGVLWCTYWCTLVYLLVFFGVLTGVLWCTYWCSFVYLLVFFVFASLSMLSVGSEPIERKQIIGVPGTLSCSITSRSRITPSANCNRINPLLPRHNANMNCGVRHNNNINHANNRWLPHRGKVPMACNLMIPYKDNVIS